MSEYTSLDVDAKPHVRRQNEDFSSAQASVTDAEHVFTLHNIFYTGCPRRNVKYFGRVFLMLNYTDITQNTYIQS